MTAGVYLSQKTKKKAAEIRDESLTRLREEISDIQVREQCCEYFRNYVNKIIAETEEEVRKFMAALRDSSICIGITIGAIAAAVFTPPTILISPGAVLLGASSFAAALRTIHSGIKVSRLHNKPEEKSAEELDLKIYDGCKIDVELCFGKVSISLRSSIKLFD